MRNQPCPRLARHSFLLLARLARLARLAPAVGALALTACGSVGWKYNYDGHQYTMTESNSQYHQNAIADVRSRFGDPAAQHDLRNLKGACELLQKYAAGAPDPGQFTPARELLDREARTTCAKAHALEAHLGENRVRQSRALRRASSAFSAEVRGSASG